jgi:hypothetical protein
MARSPLTGVIGSSFIKWKPSIYLFEAKLRKTVRHKVNAGPEWAFLPKGISVFPTITTSLDSRDFRMKPI